MASRVFFEARGSFLLPGDSVRSDTATPSALATKIKDNRYRYHLLYNGSINAHPQKLKRVFDNIMTNAIQATSGNKFCDYWFESEDRGDFVHIKIGNTGSMIPKEDLPSVFDLFFTKVEGSLA